MLVRSRAVFVALAVLVAVPLGTRGEEPFRYVEGKHGKGELRYINGLPVLTVAGTPDEMGAQAAALTAKPAVKLFTYPKDYLKLYQVDGTWPLFVAIGKGMIANFPADMRRELESFQKTSGIEPDLITTGNTMFDIKKFIACSAVIIDPDHSTTKGTLFGRNLDFDTMGYLQDYSLVTVYRPEGKHAFVAVGFPGMVGCLSGMNDAGLSLAVLEVFSTKNGEGRFDSKGTPYAMCHRRLLEECTTVQEAEKLLRSMKRTTTINLAICDKHGGAVFEITPKSVIVRKPEQGVCPCTNHFRSKELATATRCHRYEALAEIGQQKQVGLADVAKGLHAANQDWLTLQTMIFEPATLNLHLAIGPCPTTTLPLKTLELEPLFRPDAKPPAAKTP